MAWISSTILLLRDCDLINQRSGCRVQLLALLQVVNIEGPVVAMAQPFSSVNINRGGAVDMAVELKGPNKLPVSAQLFVSQRLLSPGEQYFVWTCNACKRMDPYVCDMPRRQPRDIFGPCLCLSRDRAAVILICSS